LDILYSLTIHSASWRRITYRLRLMGIVT